MVKLNNLIQTNKKIRKRLGRGSGSGTGTTAGRGTKGQKSRTGANIPNRFQGGSLPLWQRLPKKDGIKTTSIKSKIINIDQINKHFKDGETVTIELLTSKRIISASEYDKFGLKILGRGELNSKISFDPTITLSKKLQSKIAK